VASATERSGSRTSIKLRSGGWLSVLRDYAQASRPRIVGLVLFTMAITALVASPRAPSWPVLLNALLGSGLVIVGAIALNQRLELVSDAKMPRTVGRPLPAGRLSARQVTTFGIATTLAGLAYLAVLVNRPIVILAAASWVIYVWVYTPAKMLTTWQTAIGAVAGAMPALLGAAAAGESMSPVGLALFGVVYFWQFPHAMAIAWLYRDQFATAEVKLPTVVDPSGRSAAILSLMGAVVLLPVSLVPSLVRPAGLGYPLAALLLELGYLASAVGFFARRDDRSARIMLRASVVYLPLVLLALLLTFGR
jgi:protoheme IX farnesyltransferase